MTAPTPNSMPGAQGQQPPAAPANTPPAPPVEPAPPTPPAAPAAPAAPAPGDQPAAPMPVDAPKSPWESSGEPFDPERAWNLIQNLRTENSQIKAQTQPIIDAQEAQRRAEQGELANAREDLTKAAERESTWRTRAIESEAKSLAADKFINADDALAFVGDLSGFIDGDTIDATKLQQRLDQLATEKPYLVKQPAAQGFTPNRGQGQSGAGQVPIDAQIEAAQKAGNFELAIALKQQKYAPQAQR